MKTLTVNQVAAGLLNDFIDVEHLEYFHLKPLYEVKRVPQTKLLLIFPKLLGFLV